MLPQVMAMCCVAQVAAGEGLAGELTDFDASEPTLEAELAPADADALDDASDEADAFVLPHHGAALWEDRVDAARYLRDPVDLNTAGAATLRRLPGMGPRDAQAIVAGRPYEALSELTARHILDEAQLDAIASFVFVRPLRAPRRSQAQSRTLWQSDDHVATGLGVGTAVGAYRAGAAAAVQAMRERLTAKQVPLQLKLGSMTLHDAFVQRTAGQHTWVLGYYDIGFGDRLTLDTTRRTVPDGIARGVPSWEQRPPKLLGGAYTWEQHPAQARGFTLTAFTAVHPAYSELGGGHLAYAFDARRRVGATGYAALAVADPMPSPSSGTPPSTPRITEGTVYHAVGIEAVGGWGACDVASEGAVAAGGLAYSLRVMCEPAQGWQLGALWRDVDARFEHPFFRAEYGRPVNNRRMAGAWVRVRMPRWQTSARVDVSRAHDPTQARGSAARATLPTWSVRHQAGVVVHPRHALRTRARSWTGKARSASPAHTFVAGWIYGTRRGLSTELALSWRQRSSPASPAGVVTTGRIGWRYPKWMVGAYGTTGLEVAHWRAGLLAGHRVADTTTLSVRLHIGQKSAATPLQHSGLVVANVAF